MEYKVYLSLGFHINFYHSWRGDTPDEAGFGTDIRVVREALKMLNKANQAGLAARAYWDTEVYFTFQKILPAYAPDIIEGIRHRVNAGLDEIVVGPFNNGANHAATEDEFRASLSWALENEWGSGLRQLFGKVAPLYRSQETMHTTGQEAILKEYGLNGIMLYYAGVPFNTISTFLPTLTDVQRYNPLWFRSHEEQPRLLMLPMVGVTDFYEDVSLENLMRKLHQRQINGEIQSDVLINLNEDADLDTWLPMGLPKVLSWFPNLGGLEEYIHIVNRYPWAEFALPSEYAATHPPTTEIMVRQDLADGGFDGSYSWAEKSASLRIWSLLEQSRLASYRAETLAKRNHLNLDDQLWDGMDSAFFQRLIGLSTTHFGMSTPIINEERQAKALELLGNSRQTAETAERQAALACRKNAHTDALYEFEVYPTPTRRGALPDPAASAVKLPVILPAGMKNVRVETAAGERIQSSLTDLTPLPGGRFSAAIRFVTSTEPDQSLQVKVYEAEPTPSTFVKKLQNPWLDVTFSEAQGIQDFLFNGETIGKPGFLRPFITYGKRSYHPAGYVFETLPGESWNGLHRVRMKTAIPMNTEDGMVTNHFAYTFTLFDQLPYLFVEVHVRYAYTQPRQLIHNMTQKLRRLMDLHWVETAPFQLSPAFSAPADTPLRVWKHNYLGITAWYDLDYGKINPKNKNLDTFNHQVTAGWVAVSNGKLGLLVGENAETLTSMAFCPMRLAEQQGLQSISLNPFGSYYGKQMDYSHLGGNGTGKVVMETFSGALQPNGPSFNGEELNFSLLLAPYSGDAPPMVLQHDAAAHFYPSGVIVHQSPLEFAFETTSDIHDFSRHVQHLALLESDVPVSTPNAFLANASDNAVDLVWDPPRGGPVSKYEIQWQYQGMAIWETRDVAETTRLHLDNLENDRPMQFRIRAWWNETCSAWSSIQTCTPGAVQDTPSPSMLGAMPKWTLLKIVIASILAVVRAWKADR